MKNESASGGAKAVSDEQLIAQFQAGELSAFEEIVGRYQGQLINFVGRLLNDRNTAEILCRRPSCGYTATSTATRRSRGSPPGFIPLRAIWPAPNCAAAKSATFSHLAARGNREGLRDPRHRDQRGKVGRGGMVRDLILKEVMQLPVYFREVIILRDLQDLSYEEISQI